MELIEFVKNNRIVYSVYSLLVSVFVNLLKLFVKTDDKLILFVSYGGRHYNDSPKCIYEKMLSDGRFKDYRLVWAFRDPADKPVKESIKIDTLKYYVTALKARCWITNVVIERGLNFTGKHTYYFHTTHGTLPKVSGNDEKNPNVFGSTFKYKYDCSCAQSEEEKKFQLGMFGLKPNQVLVCGYPKNDILANPKKVDRDSILKELGISSEKKVILYAPTFREHNINLSIPLNIDLWFRELGEEYVLLFRAHPVIADRIKTSSQGFLYNVSNYPDNMKLMISSDYLISDYSGIFFEYAILNRPMFCYAYDYDLYVKERGLYIDMRELLPSGDERQIIKMIKNPEQYEVYSKVQRLRDLYVTAFGNATATAVDNIYNHIV